MTHRVEYITKCRRLFYVVETGAVAGLTSGGGALSELHGSDLVNATFNDATASERFGVVEAYYSPIGGARPLTVDKAKVEGLVSKARSLVEQRAKCLLGHRYGDCTECTDLYEQVCDLRDGCLGYARPRQA